MSYSSEPDSAAMHRRTKTSEDYPLPSAWRKRMAPNGRPYFIHVTTKESTWIDPRDKLWKKQTWQECMGDETPYGWEIAQDPVVGRYFIDHLRKRNVLEDPRSTVFQEQLAQVQQQVETLEAQVQAKRELSERHVQTLRELGKEMAQQVRAATPLKRPRPQQQQYQSQDDLQRAHVNVGGTKSKGTSTSPANVEEERRLRMAKERQAIEQLEREIQELQQRIADMRALIQSLKGTTTGSNSVSSSTETIPTTTTTTTTTKSVTDVNTTTTPAPQEDPLEQQKQIQEEIEHLEQVIAQEQTRQRDIQESLGAMQRSFLAETKNHGKKEGVSAAERLEARRSLHLSVQAVEKSLSPAMQPAKLHSRSSVSSPQHQTASSSSSSTGGKQSDKREPSGGQTFTTRVERQLHLLTLRKRLQREQEETARLQAIAELAKREVERALAMADDASSQTERGKLPQWIQLLNENTRKSESVRQQAKQKAEQAVEGAAVMSFRDRLLFFTSAPLASGDDVPKEK